MEALFPHTPSLVVACCSAGVALLLPKSLLMRYESTLQPRQACCMTNSRIQINIQHKVQTQGNWPIRDSFRPNSTSTPSRSHCSMSARSGLYWLLPARDFRDYLGAGQSASHPAAGAAGLSQTGMPDCNHFPSSNV